MSTAVLVHGGLHGGWCWDRVRPLLEEDGWTIYTPDLTGLGARAREASPGVTLATHIHDIVELIERRDLREVVLCGHSAAGMVISGVAEAIPERLRALIYLDAVVPVSGQSMFDIVGPEMVAELKEQARHGGQGWLVPAASVDPAVEFGTTDPADAKWVKAHLVDHPMRAFSDPVHLESPPAQVSNRVYVRCTAHANRPHLDSAMDAADASPDWTVHQWPSAHDVMVTEPDRIRSLFATLASC